MQLSAAQSVLRLDPPDFRLGSRPTAVNRAPYFQSKEAGVHNHATKLSTRRLSSTRDGTEPHRKPRMFFSRLWFVVVAAVRRISPSFKREK